MTKNDYSTAPHDLHYRPNMAVDKRHEQFSGRALPSQNTENDAASVDYGGDLSKARDLYDTVNKALTTTVNGEFFEGSKSSNINRHRQLPEIFQLRDKSEGLVESVAKKERLIAEQDRIKNEGPSKPAVSSATIQAMVQSAVEQQLEKKLRDEMIKRERVEERLQKLEDKQPTTIDGAKKIRKIPPPNQDDVKILQRKVAALEATLQNAETENITHKIQITELKFGVMNLRCKTDGHDMDIVALQQKQKTIAAGGECMTNNNMESEDDLGSDIVGLIENGEEAGGENSEGQPDWCGSFQNMFV